MLVKAQIIYWRDIPAQIKVRAGRQRLSRPLAQRFQIAIDEAAGEAGDWQEYEGDAEGTVVHLVADLESQYSRRRVQTLVEQGGWEAGGGPGDR